MPSKIISDIRRRINEEEDYFNIPLCHPYKTKQCILSNRAALMPKEPNNCCYIEGDIPLIIDSIMQESEGQF